MDKNKRKRGDAEREEIEGRTERRNVKSSKSSKKEDSVGGKRKKWHEFLLDKHAGLIILLITTGILLITAPLLRIASGTTQFYDSRDFYTQREAGSYKLEGEMSDRGVGGRFKKSLTAGVVKLFKNWSKFLPLTAGLLTISFLYLLLYSRKREYALLTSIIFAFSPIFIKMYTSLSSYGFALAFLTSGLWLLEKHKYLGSVLFSLGGLFSPVLAGASAVAVLITNFADKKKVEDALILLVLTAVASFVTITVFRNSLFLENSINLHTKTLFFSELGALRGVSLALFLSAVIGLLSRWSAEKKKKVVTNSLFLLLVAGSLFTEVLIPLLGITASFYAAEGLRYVYLKSGGGGEKQSWIIKSATLLIICTLLFGGISFEKKISGHEPGSDFAGVGDFLKEKEDGVVVSALKYTNYIALLSEKRVLLPQYSKMSRSRRREVESYAERIFSARRMNQVEDILKEKDIKYFLITEEMKNGLVWQREEGLLFLLENSNSFEKIKEIGGVELWEYTLSSS